MDRFLARPILSIFLLFLIWRLLLFFIAFISPSILPEFGARFPYYQERLVDTGLPHFVWSFGNFDGVHYLGIAEVAYSAQFTQVFFPLYPILIKLTSLLTFGNLLIAALLVSNIAFFIGLTIFYKLISYYYDRKTALWSCLFLLAFPTSYYFGAIYTEGLFFLMIIASFYLASQKKILAASIIGSFASATRLVGLFLAIALSLGKKTKSLLPLAIVPIGFLAYVLYLAIEFGKPLYFLSAQTIFGQERATSQIILIPQVIWRYLKILATTDGLAQANAVFELLSALASIGLLIFAIKKVRVEWLVFSFLAIIAPTLTGTFASMPRYIIVAFPIYLILAQLQNLKLKVLFLTISIILLVITTVLFTQGYWIA